MRTGKTETVLVDENFESAWPTTPWRVYHGSEAADCRLGPLCLPSLRSILQHLVCRFRKRGAGDGEAAPLHTASWTVAGPFDLTETTTGTLSFDLWLKTEIDS